MRPQHKERVAQETRFNWLAQSIFRQKFSAIQRWLCSATHLLLQVETVPGTTGKIMFWSYKVQQIVLALFWSKEAMVTIEQDEYRHSKERHCTSVQRTLSLSQRSLRELAVILIYV